MDSKSIGLCPQGFESPRCRCHRLSGEPPPHKLRNCALARVTKLPGCTTDSRSTGNPFAVAAPSLRAELREATALRPACVARPECVRKMGAGVVARTWWRARTTAHASANTPGCPCGMLPRFLRVRRATASLIKQDRVSERLGRWTRNPLGSASRNSNPLAVVWGAPSVLGV